jgi:hypothetical protein
MKSALFVDFDNVYSGLRKVDQASADRFARRPMEWMNWVVSSLELPEHVAEGARRRVLVRRCYLNPQAYQRFRPAFNLAGFEIVDCPALTSEGKTSTDIHMVLDIIDLLQHEAHYDEFIVFSADADFTPVLRKLRRWDRRTTVLAIGFPSAAYRASADLLIDQDDFVRNALGFRDEDETPTVSVMAASIPLSSVVATPARTQAEIVSAACDLIRQKVDESSVAVPLPRLASLMLSDVAGMDTANWAGFGSFRSLIESLSLAPLALNWESGGYVYDPKRHSLPAAPKEQGADSAQADWGADRKLLAVAKQVCEVTNVPLLSADRYRALFDVLAVELATERFDLLETSKRVRDRCRDRGKSVSRADVTFVLRGLLLRGHAFGEGRDDAATLSRKWADNVRSLCLREQMILDQATDAAILKWIAGVG